MLLSACGDPKKSSHLTILDFFDRCAGCALPASATGGGRARLQILTGFASSKLAVPKQKPPLKEWWFVLELLARFELATSSLPKISSLFCAVADCCSLTPEALVLQVVSGFSFCVLPYLVAPSWWRFYGAGVGFVAVLSLTIQTSGLHFFIVLSGSRDTISVECDSLSVTSSTIVRRISIKTRPASWI